jgi:hypothetical protein
MGTNSFLTLCVAFASLLVLQSTLVVAFSFKNAPFVRTLSHTMTRFANDGRQPTSNEGHHNDILPARKRLHERQREEWISRSVDYYSKVMREERRRAIGQVSGLNDPGYQEQFVILAKKHYFALRKIKDGNLHQAEWIYRKIIEDLSREDESECDHAKLAVTTLLLALLMQRMGDCKGTRSVFLRFFRIAVLDNEETECACSAKVLQAFALFEMKQGHAQKSLELVKRAIKFDNSLAPVLQWKQFRDVVKRQAKHGTS